MIAMKVTSAHFVQNVPLRIAVQLAVIQDKQHSGRC